MAPPLQLGELVKFFVDREDAGRTLARGLERHIRRDAIILGLHGGGVTVAEAVGRYLGVPVEPWRERARDLAGRLAILVGDGASSGHEIADAVREARRHGARKVIVAVPVAAVGDVEALEDLAHEVVCPFQPRRIGDVSEWYDLFHDDGRDRLAA